MYETITIVRTEDDLIPKFRIFEKTRDAPALVSGPEHRPECDRVQFQEGHGHRSWTCTVETLKATDRIGRLTGMGLGFLRAKEAADYQGQSQLEAPPFFLSWDCVRVDVAPSRDLGCVVQEPVICSVWR